MTNIDTEQIITEMKERIKTHPVLKKYLKRIMDDGIDEETALNIMIHAWLQGR